MPADFIQITIPAGIVGGAITLVIREFGGKIFAGHRGNGDMKGKLSREEHALLCNKAYQRVEIKIDKMQVRIDRIFELLADK